MPARGKTGHLKTGNLACGFHIRCCEKFILIYDVAQFLLCNPKPDVQNAKPIQLDTYPQETIKEWSSHQPTNLHMNIWNCLSNLQLSSDRGDLARIYCNASP